MNMSQFETINEVWNALDEGKTVYCSNESYKITIEPTIPNNEFQLNHFTRRGDQVLRVTCIENYFGSLLSESELGKLFTKDKP
jgi:hypothetical protein